MTIHDIANAVTAAYEAAPDGKRIEAVLQTALDKIDEVLHEEGLAMRLHEDGTIDVTLQRNPNALTMREMLQKVADANKT